MQDSGNSSKIIEQVAQMLNSSLNNTTPSNVQANRGLWDSYAQSWSQESPHIKQMIGDVEKQTVNILGEEWSDDQSLNQVLQEMILPNC